MSTLEENARRIAKEASDRYGVASGRRILLAVAGAPGSGKSAIAERVVDILNERAPDAAALFPMDGFHFDDALLVALGRHARKGAIDTFDVHGLRAMLERLRKNDDDAVAVPVFDRAIEIARAGGRLIPRQTRIVVCEGNYLLMRQAPWDRLYPLFDFTVFVDVSEDALRRRLQARWAGYGLTADVIARKVEGNDLPNGRAIIEGSVEAHLRVPND